MLANGRTSMASDPSLGGVGPAPWLEASSGLHGSSALRASHKIQVSREQRVGSGLDDRRKRGRAKHRAPGKRRHQRLDSDTVKLVRPSGSLEPRGSKINKSSRPLKSNPPRENPAPASPASHISHHSPTSEPAAAPYYSVGKPRLLQDSPNLKPGTRTPRTPRLAWHGPGRP